MVLWTTSAKAGSMVSSTLMLIVFVTCLFMVQERFEEFRTVLMLPNRDLSFDAIGVQLISCKAAIGSPKECRTEWQVKMKVFMVLVTLDIIAFQCMQCTRGILKLIPCSAIPSSKWNQSALQAWGMLVRSEEGVVTWVVGRGSEWGWPARFSVMVRTDWNGTKVTYFRGSVLNWHLWQAHFTRFLQKAEFDMFASFLQPK